MFPKLDDLIEDLFEMRQDPLIGEFRKFIHSNTFASSTELTDRIQESTGKLLRGTRPDKDGGLLLRIFNNMPLGPIPISPSAILNDYFEFKAE